jgi:hypothetical protein
LSINNPIFLKLDQKIQEINIKFSQDSKLNSKYVKKASKKTENSLKDLNQNFSNINLNTGQSAQTTRSVHYFVMKSVAQSTQNPSSSNDQNNSSLFKFNFEIKDTF